MSRLGRAVLAACALLAAAVPPVGATHTHVAELGNGSCVLLSEAGGEKEVVLPLPVFDANPTVTIAPTVTRMHPLHVLVHLGEAGSHHVLAVAGTAAAAELCPGGIVND